MNWRSWSEAAGFLDHLIHRDPRKIDHGQMLLPNRQPNGFLEQRFLAIINDTVTPLGHTDRMDRTFILNVGRAAVVLPAGIFDPAIDLRLTRLVKRAFEIMQAYHQTNRLGRLPATS